MSYAPVSIGFYLPDAGDPQAPAEVAVVTPTIVRPSLSDAMRSVYRQDIPGRIQILVGVDRASGDIEALRHMFDERPQNVSVCALHLPYSTATRHGGLHTAIDGGALRSILSFMANSRFVAYLDDDNLWLPRHLRLLRQAIEGKVWSYSQRMVVDQDSGRDLGVDRFDSVGPGAGRFKPIGGFVDPNCLMLDKVVGVRALGRWSETVNRETSPTADRNFFMGIAQTPHGFVPEPTVCYFIRPTNILHRLFAAAPAAPPA